MKDEELLQLWKDRIRKGIKYQHKYGKPESWATYEKRLRCEWEDKGDIIPVNLIHAFGKAIIPKIYARNPRITLRPNNPQIPYLKIKAAETVVNWYIRKLDIKGQIKRMVADNYSAGTAVLFFGYDGEFGYVPDHANPLIEGLGTTDRFSSDMSYIEYNKNIFPGSPWALRERPLDVIVPFGGVTIGTMPWIAHRSIRLVEDVKVDTRYAPCRKDVKANKQITGEGTYDDEIYREMMDKEEYVELWEVRDFKTRKIYTFSIDHDKFLVNEIDNLQFNDLPAAEMIFNADPVAFWGIPDARVIEPQQDELNEIRTQARAHRAAATLKVLTIAGALKPEDKKKLLSGIVAPIIELSVDDIGKAIALLQPHVPMEFGPLSEQILSDVRQMLGMSSNQAGEYTGGRKTATEATIVQVASELRIDERRDVAADLLVTIGKKILQMVSAFQATDEGIIPVLSPSGVTKWAIFQGRDLIDDYDYVVNPDECLPYNVQVRMKNAQELYQIGRQDPLFNPVELVTFLLEQYPEANPDRLLNQSGWGNNQEQAMPFNALSNQIRKEVGVGQGANVPGKMQKVQ
jgi:hypothetical protein